MIPLAEILILIGTPVCLGISWICSHKLDSYDEENNGEGKKLTAEDWHKVNTKLNSALEESQRSQTKTLPIPATWTNQPNGKNTMGLSSNMPLGGANMGLPNSLIINTNSRIKPAKQIEIETNAEEAAEREARLQALEIQTNYEVDKELSPERLRARAHPRYKVLLERACVEMRARYNINQNEKVKFIELPDKTQYFRALDAQIQRVSWETEDKSIEEKLQRMRRGLSAVYRGLENLNEATTSYAIMRLADEYLPDTIDAYLNVKNTSNETEQAIRAHQEFVEQIDNLCKKYSEIVKEVNGNLEKQLRENGRFLEAI